MRRHERAAEELARLGALFRRIDEEYSVRARGYDFRCEGCLQTCCSERFHHHTLAESLLLERGLLALPEDERNRFFMSAAGAVQAAILADSTGDASDVLCPLYRGGGCALYEYRPLICRLHGIAYEYTPPGRGAVRGEGCHRFAEEVAAAGKAYEPFDRTPFFSEMAAIEIAVRRRLNFGERLRRTVAEIITEIDRELGS